MTKLPLFFTFLCIGLGGWVTGPHRPEMRSTKQSIRRDTLPAAPETFGFGKPATTAQIALLDIDVRPNGAGLPAGSGTVAKGKVVFANKCVACHGPGGTGGTGGALVMTTTESGKRPAAVIGNYWPYATTIFDYIRRAMPFSEPGSLTNDEVYALTAFLLNANKVIDETITLNAQTLPAVKMPAQPRFVPDARRGGPEIH